ncbi:ATP-binding domain-containing protein 4 [Mitosporidium daphniae]|uniref:Diphthine--ammonia ligase n=1 Tax=Mitosporidium daphniae TaxID=1485682 RepID=A0A098VVX4_9MICR|nr:ATP-binding domain-containing protein 4 [Mitosporidium daphniae]KGG53075.1 ATP-binding domain-containing protein 4 [Mitosporidium daphniae]|eukprot:XP_013239511.1 ATP-binding domain-containing protein 4 [Mitosporidium daphniae]
MKFVALIRYPFHADSIFTIFKCIQEGHVLVAVANLEPPADQEELDSYMYQSVGHRAVPYIAEALSVPLMREKITGTAIKTSLHYDDKEYNPMDEVEDLTKLLARVEAVSAGAIFSKYQKDRVESVAIRLNLHVLAPLWEKDQYFLVKEMIACEMEVIIIKVASLGLGKEHVGIPLGRMVDHLESLSAKFGFAVNFAGEGGEYESLVLDCPLFSSRLEMYVNVRVVV